MSPAVPAGSPYNRLAMTTRFESCRLPVQSGLPCSGSGCSSFPAVASEPLHPVRRARAPAGYKHRMQQIRRLLRIEIPHRPRRRPTRSQQQSMSIPVCSSRSSLSVVVFRRHVFTRCGRSDGRVIWPNLDRAPRTHLTTGARLALLSLFVTTAFPTFAFSSITDWAKSNNLTVDLSADAIEPSHAHFNRLSWEAQLLAALQVTSAHGTSSSATAISSVKMMKASPGPSETSLCSRCIVQSAY